MNQCVFLDRDGVLNRDKVDYVYKLEDFYILEGVAEALKDLKEAGFKLVIITNQSGIAKGLYKREDVWKCYDYLQEQTGDLIDGQYFAPYHPDFDSASLTRKPNSLMIEKAIVKFKVDITKSWLVGDSRRDILAGKKLGIQSIQVSDKEIHCEEADFSMENLYEASRKILEDS